MKTGYLLSYQRGKKFETGYRDKFTSYPQNCYRSIGVLNIPKMVLMSSGKKIKMGTKKGAHFNLIFYWIISFFFAFFFELPLLFAS